MLSSILATLGTDAPGTLIDSAMGIALVVLELADALAMTATAHAGADADWFRKKIHARRRGALSWTKGHDDLAVGHVQYANRPPHFKAKTGYLGRSFQRPRFCCRCETVCRISGLESGV